MNTARLHAYAELDQERLDLQRQATVLDERLKVLEGEILEEIAAGDGAPLVKVDTSAYGRVTVYLERRIWAKCTGEDWPRACAALQDAGLGEYVQQRYNTQSLSAYLRELDKSGDPLPEPLVGAIEADARLSIRTRRS